MQVKVHGSECDHKWCVVNTMQGLVAEEITLCLVLRLMLHIVVGSKEETACATGRVAYRLSNLRTDAIHHSLNERTWGKILSCATLFILSVLLQDALINSTFHVAIHDKPLFLVNHRNDLFKIHWFVNLILRLGVDSTNEIVLAAKNTQCVLILLHEFKTVKLSKLMPLIACGDSRLLAEHLYVLCIHFEEKQISELRDIIGEANALSCESSGKIPNFLCERLRGIKRNV